MSFAKMMERTLEVMAYAWRLAMDDDYCLLADFVAEPSQKLTFPGLSVGPLEPGPENTWSAMLEEVRAKTTSRMPVAAVTRLMPVSELRAREKRRLVLVPAETRRMPVGALTALMPPPAPAVVEYEPDPPALLGEYEPNISLLFDSQRLLFPEHEVGPFQAPDFFYDN